MTTIYSGKQVKVQIVDACATLLFTNSKALNALTPQMASECFQALELLQGYEQVKVLVLRGEGKAFMAGGDLHALVADPQGSALAIIDPMHACIRLLHSGPWIVVAAVQGAAAGAGLSLVASADLALASEQAKFVYAYADIATTPDLGMSWTLPRKVGERQALEMALLGRRLNAVQAREAGLVTDVVAPDAFEPALAEWVRILSARPAHVLSATRKLFARSRSASLAEQLQSEQASFVECAAQPEFTRAIRDFLQAAG